MLEDYNNMYDDLKIIAVNLTTNDNVATVNKFVEDNAYGYSMIMDLDGTTSAPYQIEYIPFIVLLDEKGVIQYKGSAPSTVAALKSLVETSLNN